MTVWEGRISPVFDVCRQVQILDVHGHAVRARSAECYETMSTRQRIERLIARGVDTIICGAITGPVRDELITRGVEVIAFVTGETEAVVQAYLDGRVTDPNFTMPGCRARRRRRRRRRGGNGNGRRRPQSTSTGADDRREE